MVRSQGHLVIAHEIEELDKVVLPDWENFGGREHGIARACAAVSHSQGDSQLKDGSWGVYPYRPGFWAGDHTIKTRNVCLGRGKHIAASFPSCWRESFRNPDQATILGCPIKHSIQALPVLRAYAHIGPAYGVGNIFGGGVSNIRQSDLDEDFKAFALGFKSVVINAFSQARAQRQPGPQLGFGHFRLA